MKRAVYKILSNACVIVGIFIILTMVELDIYILSYSIFMIILGIVLRLIIHKDNLFKVNPSEFKKLARAGTKGSYYYKDCGVFYCLYSTGEQNYMVTKYSETNMREWFDKIKKATEIEN